jgi:phosphatidylglycerophosphatase C
MSIIPPPPFPAAIAIFDFDDTLIEGDSLWPFLCLVLSPLKTTGVFIKAFLALAIRPSRWAHEPRGYVKERVLAVALCGRTQKELTAIIPHLGQQTKWKSAIVNKLHDHHREGHLILIASGGLDLYLPVLLSDIPYHHLLCSEVDFTTDGHATGKLRQGNVVRQEKARRVAEFLKGFTGKKIPVYGYGNAPHDLPMLALCDHQTIV